MKTSKLFTIDTELAERLKNLNASELVNTLLNEYFEIRSSKNTLLEEKKAVFDSISKKKKLFLKRLRLLKNGIHLILITFRRDGLRQGLKVLREIPYAFTLKVGGYSHLQQASKKDLI